MTLNKYQDMTALASRLNEVSQRLNDKCEWPHTLTSSTDNLEEWDIVSMPLVRTCE